MIGPGFLAKALLTVLPEDGWWSTGKLSASDQETIEAI